LHGCFAGRPLKRIAPFPAALLDVFEHCICLSDILLRRQRRRIQNALRFRQNRTFGTILAARFPNGVQIGLNQRGGFFLHQKRAFA
jgi:hypothetical protein